MFFDFPSSGNSPTATASASDLVWALGVSDQSLDDGGTEFAIGGGETGAI